MKTQTNHHWNFSQIIILMILAFVLATLPGQSKRLALAQPDQSLMFIENIGQFEEATRFQIYGGGATLSLTQDALWFTIFEPPQVESLTPDNPADFSVASVQRGVNLRLSFLNANPQSDLEPFNQLDSRVSYFLGSHPANWRTDVPVWGGVRYVNLYPGIDLEISGENGQLVQRLVVRDRMAMQTNDPSGVEPQGVTALQDIGLQVAGAEALTLDGTGRLRLTTAVGEFTLPLLKMDQAEIHIEAANPTPRIEGDVVTWPFSTSSLPESRQETENSLAQVADVTDLLYSTFLGGGGNLDAGRDMAVNEAGNAYVTGQAYPGFPTTPGVFDPNIEGVFSDAFVAKLNADGSGLIYATFLGGSDLDTAWGIAIDEAGDAYLAGYTTSSDFPTTPGAFDSSFGGESDAFAAKLNATGTELIYATLLGGSSSDFGWDVAVDEMGNAYVTGFTPSPDFPTTPGAFDTSLDSWYDVFVVKLNGDGSDLAYGTLVGGNNADYSFGIAVDGAGSAYVTGYTHSTDFPTTPGVFDTSYDQQEIFVVKLNPAGSALAYATFLGGSRTEYANAIAVDETGQAYVTGNTRSADFPVTGGAFDPDYNNSEEDFIGDSFVAKLAADGSSLIYATYLGGNGDDIGQNLALDGAGRAYVTGYTTSADFPTTAGAFDTSCEGCAGPSPSADAFLVRLNPEGAALTYATYLGAGDGYDQAYGLAVDESNHAYVTGSTSSHNFPTTAGAFDTSLEGFKDVFVAKLSVEGEEPPPTPVPPHDCAPTPLGTITVGNTPRGLAVDPARQRVYVANFGSDSVSVIDSHTNTVIETITGITAANGIAHDALHNMLWVTNYNTDQVTPIEINDEATSFTALPGVDVGNGPWGVVYDPIYGYLYVANSLDDSVSVIDVSARRVATTLSGNFSQPFHLATTPVTGKVYVTNFGNSTVTVIKGTTISSVVNLYDSSQPYGITVDEPRNLVYVATVAPHRVVVIGSLHGMPDQFLGWAAFYRGFGDRNRPVPLRAIAVNPDPGPFGDGGHVWATTATADGSERNQALLIPKGWSSYFHVPFPQEVGDNPAEGIAVDRATQRVYVTGGTGPGTVTVMGDHPNLCPGVTPATLPDGTNDIEFDLFSRLALTSGDVTGDGRIDIFDLAFIASRYHRTDPAADVNGDGLVDIFDLTVAASHYGQRVSDL